MYRQAATCTGHTIKEVRIMTIHERAEALKEKLAAMGITSDEELQEAIEATRLDIALFVNKPAAEHKEETA